MGFAVSSKVYAVVLEAYVSKGVFQFEISNPKLRSGYGKVDIKYLPPDKTTAKDIQRLFQTQTKPSDGDGNDAAASSAALPEQLPEPATHAATSETKSESMEPGETEAFQQVSTNDVAKEDASEPVKETTVDEQPSPATAPEEPMTHPNAACF